MTTIAYKDGVIAYDSRITCGDDIASDSYDKMVRLGDDFIVWAGSTVEAADVLEAVIADKYPDSLVHGMGIAFISGKLYAVGLNDKEIWKAPVELFEGGICCGSGGQYAQGALDMGADPKQAVKIASKRDTSTGGKIRSVNMRPKTPNSRNASK